MSYNQNTLKSCPFCGSPMEWRSGDHAVHVNLGNTCPIAGQGFTDREKWNARIPPKVKLLVWIDDSRKYSFPNRWHTEMPCGSGDYSVTGSTRKNEWKWFRGGYYVRGHHNQEPTTLDAAKAAAQADYERRILAGLE